MGIQLRLTKNDGLLKIQFEGHNGSTAEWSFDGLTLSSGQKMVATAATQTVTDFRQCNMCGNDRKAILALKHRDTQTDTIATLSTGIQTETGMAITSTAYRQHLHQSFLRNNKPRSRTQLLPPISSAKLRHHFPAVPRCTKLRKVNTSLHLGLDIYTCIACGRNLGSMAL